MIVQKYGGSSLSTPEKIIKIAKNIIKRKENEKDIIVVVSAMGNSTDQLIQLAGEISSDPSERELDLLLSTGEQQTLALISMALNELGCKAISLTGPQARINTIGSHTRASIEGIKQDIIKEQLKEGKVVVIAGFQGVNEQGDITTLGRGGSDTTAVALAAKFKCPCEIYTDVDGIYSIDPRIYSEASIIPRVSYDVALEMSRLGAKIIHKRAIALGERFQVPIYIGNSFGNKIGTTIGGDDVEQLKISSLVVDDSQVEVKIGNIPNEIDKVSSVFSIIGNYNLDISMTENSLLGDSLSILFTCSKENIKLLSELKKEILSIVDRFIDIEINDTIKVSIIGTGRINQAEITSKVFETIKETGMKYKRLCTSELSLSYFFEGGEVTGLVKRIAMVFNL
jgi:aspartate kinase